MGKLAIFIILILGLAYIVFGLYKAFTTKEDLQSDLNKGNKAKEKINNLHKQTTPNQQTDGTEKIN